MAKEEVLENEDFISLEEDDEEEQEPSASEQEETEENLDDTPADHKKLYILIAIFALLAFAILGFLLYLYLQKKAHLKEEAQTQAILKNLKRQEIPKPKTTTPAYEKELQKARKLFAQGHKKEALAIYETLSRYNKALTAYNVGVAKLKEKAYDKAIDAFKTSQKHPKLTFVSQLNIAIAAYAQKDMQTFQHYLDLAKKSLPSILNAPLYGYYHALIDTYSAYYAEALLALKNPTSDYFEQEKKQLQVKLYSAFDNNKEALRILEKAPTNSDYFTLGLLYAKEAEYPLAEKYLLKAAQEKKKPLAENMALSLVYLNMGLYQKSSQTINTTYKLYQDKSSTIYPIKVSLKASLFDPVAAQKEFQKRVFFDLQNRYSLLFYFAPYRFMNPDLSISNIQKGAKNIYVNALEPAQTHLDISGNISDANLEITQGIKAALEKNLYQAKKIFIKGLKKYPSSAQLHYNLALTYARLFDFQNAYIHFKKSTALDVTDAYAPIFSYYCAQLLFKDKEMDKNFLAQLEEQIQNNLTKRQKTLALSLLAIAKEDIQLGDTSLDKDAFEDAIVLVLAQIRGEFALYKKSTEELVQKLPNNLVANLLHIDAHHDSQEIKTYAKAIQARLHQKDLDFNPLYSGYAFVKELGVQMYTIAGIVPDLRAQLETKLQKLGKNDTALLQALAYVDIYNQEFDQAYAIYNHLIDKQKQQDSNTLFLGAISSIGAKHHENAIALLELAKLTNASNLESRFALGLLYHEIQNLEGASIQYAKIGDVGFASRYFAFNLDKNLLKP